MSFEVSEKAMARAREEFQRVLDSAVPPYELARQGHFTDEEEAFIQKEIEHLLFEPELPNAGDTGWKIIKRLKQISYASFWEKSQAAANWISDDGENNDRAKRKELSPCATINIAF